MTSACAGLRNDKQMNTDFTEGGLSPVGGLLLSSQLLICDDLCSSVALTAFSRMNTDSGSATETITRALQPFPPPNSHPTFPPAARTCHRFPDGKNFNSDAALGLGRRPRGAAIGRSRAFSQVFFLRGAIPKNCAFWRSFSASVLSDFGETSASSVEPLSRAASAGTPANGDLGRNKPLQMGAETVNYWD